MNGIAAYNENSVTTKTPGQTVVLLYDGALKFLNLAIKCIEDKDFAGKGEYINRAVAIINELDCSLNMEAGGEIATNLRKLYDFMRKHLLEANFKCDPGLVRDVIRVLEELNQGWRAIVE